jgi:DinB superfamily
MTQLELLERLEADLKSMLEDLRTQAAVLPEAALRWRPSTDRWNAMECFAHLNAFFDLYLSRIELAIHKSKARRWTPGDKINYSMMGRSDLKKANPYNGRALRAKKKYDFFQSNVNANELKRFIINAERLLRYIDQSKEIDLNRAKIARGPSGFFKYTLGNTLEWLVVHAQRHVNQVNTLLKAQ